MFRVTTLAVVAVAALQCGPATQPFTHRDEVAASQPASIVINSFDLGGGSRMTYVRTTKSVPHPITDEATVVPWFELRYRPKEEGNEQLVAWQTTTDDEIPWKIVRADCDGQTACIVVNRYGFCWLEAWRRDPVDGWRQIVARPQNSGGKDAQGPTAARADIRIARDGVVSVTAIDQSNGIRTYELSSSDLPDPPDTHPTETWVQK